MNLWICFSIVVAILLAIGYVRGRRRSAAIRSLAARLGFHCLAELPMDLSLSRTLLSRVSEIWNVIGGERNGVKVVVFDCRIGTGKGSWCRTVIATQSESETFGAEVFNLDLSVDRLGNWTFLYEPKALSFVPRGLMPASEVEAHLSAIGKIQGLRNPKPLGQRCQRES